MKALLSALLIFGMGTAQAQETLAPQNQQQGSQVNVAALVGITLRGVVEVSETLPGERGEPCDLKFKYSKGALRAEVGGFSYSGEFVLDENGALGEIEINRLPRSSVKRTLFVVPVDPQTFVYRLMDEDGNLDFLCIGAKPGVF